MTRHIFNDHYKWVETEEWVHDGKTKWEKKKIKTLVYTEKL